MKRKFDSLAVPKFLRRRKRSRRSQPRERSFKKAIVVYDDGEEEQEQAQKSVLKKPNQARNNGIVFREPESGKNRFLESLKHNADDNRTREEVLKYERSLKKPLEQVKFFDDSDDDVSPIFEEVSEVRLSNGVVFREPGPSNYPFIVFPEESKLTNSNSISIPVS